MMTSSLDVRAWNLFAGAALLAGCTARPSDGAADESSTSMGSTEDGTESSDSETDTTGTETTTDSTETGDPPECRSDDDCDTYYLCNNGMCVECITTADCAYQDGLVCIGGECVLDPDLPGGQICWDDDECPEFEICRNFGGFGHGYCQPAGDPLPNCEPGLTGIPTVLDPDAPPLALSFVDVDADGRDELAVATETELLVYEVGVDVPTVTAREMPSVTVRAMVAGQFDAQPGEDLALLVDGDLHRYFADGVAGFVNPNFDLSPVVIDPDGLIAGDFDGIAAMDLLVWGLDSAAIDLGDATVPLFQGTVYNAAAFDQSVAEPGVLLADGDFLQLFELAGAAVTTQPTVNISVVAAHSPMLRRYVSLQPKGSWSILWLWNPVSLDQAGSVLHPNIALELAAGDFDGDQHDEIVTIDSEVTLVFSVLDGDPRRDRCIATVDLGVAGAITGHAIGDHDGDGDDELAVALDTGVVVIVDGE
jgi:hypothetical protein